MADKIYLNGVYVREKVFADGGAILNVSIDAEKMLAFLTQHKNERGYVNICIGKRSAVSDKGVTHSAWLDTWKPKERADGQKNTKDGIPF